MLHLLPPLLPAALAAAGHVLVCGLARPDATARPATAVGAQARPPRDAIQDALLAGSVPLDVVTTRAKLLAFGGTLTTHVVANRGHDNPAAGSFSFFEAYEGPTPAGPVAAGELFLGFFSERQGDTLAVSQAPDAGLIIEAIAWDQAKQAYNFWELVGDGQRARWHHRGDSFDVLADVAGLSAEGPGGRFGNRLRCSGCHTTGGPIMKELVPPHNDWWTTRDGLRTAPNRLRADGTAPQRLAAALFARATDASRLASLVRAGNLRAATLATRVGTPRQALRSLLSPMELNLASDLTPYQAPGHAAVVVPAAFFVDPRLTGPQPGIAVPRATYEQARRRAGVRFAPGEADGPEAFHAFVVPVPSDVDARVVDALVRRGLLDDELVADVLAVDLTTAMFAAPRARLARWLPPAPAADAPGLRRAWIARLGPAAATDADARALLTNLTAPDRTARDHRARALRFLARCREAAQDPAVVAGWLALAAQRRAEAAAAPTAQSPRGNILEPGFRVIFPVDGFKPEPGGLRLDEATGAVGDSQG